jgi:hypothetical protein
MVRDACRLKSAAKNCVWVELRYGKSVEVRPPWRASLAAPFMARDACRLKWAAKNCVWVELRYGKSVERENSPRTGEQVQFG